MRVKTLLCAAAAPFVLLAVGTSEMHAAPSGGVADAEQPERVVVTARLRPEPLADTPIAASVIRGSALESGHLESTTDLASQLANVEVAQPFGNVFPAFVVRGVGLNDYNVNNNPTVGVYRDDVYLSSNAMIPRVLFDLDQIEVVKGPQGTLEGRNTTGGAVRLLSAEPGDTRQAYLDVGYGNYNTADVRGAMSGLVAPRLRVRVAGFGERRFDGYQLDRTTNTRSGQIRTWGLRGIAIYEPNDDFTFRLTLNGGQDKSDVQRFQHRGVLGPQCQVATKGIWDPAVCFDAFGYHDTDGDKLAGDYSLNPRMDDSSLGTTLKAEWTPANWKLTSITNAEAYDYVHGNEEDASPQRVVEITYNSHIRQLSEELRLSYDDKDQLNWVVGAFAGDYRHREHRRADVTDAERAFGPFFGSPIVDLPYLQVTRTAAGFADGVFKLLPGLKLEGGLRYTNESVSYRGGTVLPLFGNAPIVQVDDRIESDNFSWRANLSYSPREHALVYGQVSTGFKSGGFFGGFAFNPAELKPYRPETVTAYEIGAKAELMSGLSADGAVFFYDYKDLQAIAIGSRGVNRAFTIPTLTNLPGATIYGAELNVSWKATDDLSVRTEIGLLHTRINGPAFTLGSAGAAGPLFDIAGNELPRSPAVSISETLSHSYHISSALDLLSELNISFRSKQHMDLNNFPMATQNGFATINASFHLTYGSQWEVAVWGRNLTNVLPYLGDGPIGFGERDLVIYGMPRTFGITTRYSF